jgi:hypothetical protein
LLDIVQACSDELYELRFAIGADAGLEFLKGRREESMRFKTSAISSTTASMSIR